MILFNEHIEKDVVAEMPICTINGKIIIINKPEMVADAIADLRACPLIGFDTETKPSFKKGESNSVSLLQLATDTTAYLFRLKEIGENKMLKNLLEDKEILKVGLSVHDDFRALNKWMPCMPQNFIELQRYVKAFGIEELSLQKIYAIIFNEKISKRQQLSNWESEELTAAQQLYAATDAWACRNIYLELQNWLAKNK